jgi:hypothetical protein
MCSLILQYVILNQNEAKGCVTNSTLAEQKQVDVQDLANEWLRAKSS